MPNNKILVCDNVAEEGVAILREQGFEVTCEAGLSHDALLEVIAGYDALLVRSKTQVGEDVIAAGASLQVIGRAGVGVDNIDVPAATRRGIVVMNTPEGNTITTAELAISLLLSLVRNIPQADRSIREGKWEKSRFTGTEISGKTIGIVGLGRIGRVVAERALGLNLRVLAMDPYVSAEEPPVRGIEVCDLDRLVAESDFVTIHVPLNDSTRGLFDEARLRSMKPSARLVCAARGGIVDEEALHRVLVDGHLAGAALDVFAEEPLRADHPLRELDQVIFTPHLGASTDEAQKRVSTDLARQVALYLREGVAFDAVNAPKVSREGMRVLGPYLELGQKLGTLATRLMDGDAKRIELSFQGPLVAKEKEALRLAVLVGVLSPAFSTPVNFVNAPLLARERHLEVFEREDSEPREFVNHLSVRVIDAKGRAVTACGTAFGRAPRLTRLDDFLLDASLHGHLIVTRHRDRPGVIGRIGSILGDAAINIERLQLGDTGDEDDSMAIGILNVDREPNDEVLAQVRAFDAILDVRHVEL